MSINALSAPASTSGRPTMGLRRRVLLAADRAEVAPPMSRVLDGNDIEVELSSTPSEVLDRLRRKRYNLVLFGPDPVEGSVAETIRLIRQDPALERVALVVVTEPSEADRATELRAAGANAILCRPLQPDFFDQKLEKLLSVAVRVMVRLMVEGEVDNLRVGFTRNLSSSGLLVEAERPMKLGSTLGLRFFLPGRSSPIEARARVARNADAGQDGGHVYGLAFVHVEDAASRAIDDFIRKKAHR